jgi:hypothetical protein
VDRLILTAQLLETRDTIKKLFDHRYKEVIRPWRDIVRASMKKNGCKAIEVPVIVSKEMEAAGAFMSGETLAMLTAAAVEEIENGDE